MDINSFVIGFKKGKEIGSGADQGVIDDLAARINTVDETVSDLADEFETKSKTWDATSSSYESFIDTYAENMEAVDDSIASAKKSVTDHNVSTEAHNDIRLLIKQHEDSVNALLNSDDETLNETKEIVAYIKSNKSLIDSITASKVNVADIINNLTTNAANKPLSASQGVALKAMIDQIALEGGGAGQAVIGDLTARINTVDETVSDLADTFEIKSKQWDATSSSYENFLDTYAENMEAVDDSIASAKKSVTDHNVSTEAHNDIRLLIKQHEDSVNALLNSDDETLNETKEIVAYIKSNKSLIDSITTSKVNVADIINNLTTNAANKPLSASQGVALKALIDVLQSGKLDASALNSAINTALGQAKASGEFDGKDGKSAYEIAQENGYKGSLTDFFADMKGEKGEDGEDGNDGRSAYEIYLDNGGTIGTEKAWVDSLVGKDGESFYEMCVKNGFVGSETDLVIAMKGEKGDKGDAYTLTSADVSSIANEAIAKMNLSLGIASDGLIYIFVNGVPVGTGVPQGQSGDVFGYVDENNTVVLTGNLPDGTYTVKYEMNNGTMVNVGNMALDSNVYYSVTNTLTKCSTNNSTKTVVEGGSYTATITPNSGHNISTVKVTMGGKDVTSSAYSNGKITIASVTGDIVITATAAANTYSVTKNLTNCAISNTASSVTHGASYSATVTANSGYTLKSVTATMGGSAVTVTNGVISIASVTGNIVITATAEVGMVNQIPISTDASGNLFVGTNGEKGYKTGYRISASSGNESAQSGAEVTGFIPVKTGDTMYIKGINVNTAGTNVLGFYNSSRKSAVVTSNPNTGVPMYYLFPGGVNGEVRSVVLNATTIGNDNFLDHVAYIRVSADKIDGDSIITINQPIS